MQSKDKNDSVQFSSRYWAYTIAKRHLRGTSRPEVFPIGETVEADNVLSTLIARYWRSQANGDYIRNKQKEGMTLLHTAYPDLREYKDISPTISTPSGGGHLPMVAQALQTDGQLRSGSSFGTNNPQSSRNIRRLTPTECERLQGFPDDWTKYGLFAGVVKEISDTQRYKTLGNAVTTNVIRDIVLKWKGEA